MAAASILIAAALVSLITYDTPREQAGNDSRTLGGPNDAAWFEGNGYTKITTKQQLSDIGTVYPLDGKFYLGNDITLGVFTPIGTMDDPFTGIFDGAGFAIKDADISSSGEDEDMFIGLFGYTVGSLNAAEIRNVRVSGTVTAVLSESGDAYVGGIAGYALDTKITGCSFSGTVKASVGEGTLFIGGIAGYMTDSLSEITSCSNTGSVEAAGSLWTYAGGIVGYAVDLPVTGCSNTGAVSYTVAVSYSADLPQYDVRSYIYVGGIIGSSESSPVTECSNTGAVSAAVSVHVSKYAEVSATVYVGGIAGNISGMYYDTSLTGCSNTGAVSSTASATASSEGSGVYPHAYAYLRTGGIAGSAHNAYITECSNTGAVNAETSYSAPDEDAYVGDGTYTGGILGAAVTVWMTDCSSTGTVKASSEDQAVVGGIIGVAVAVEVTECSFEGIVKALSNDEAAAGGIIGGADTAMVTLCHNTGKIEAASSDGAVTAGGIMGMVYSSEAEYCYNTGSVKAVSDNSRASAGGIAGKVLGLILSKSFNSGSVETDGKYTDAGFSGSSAGGVVGHAYNLTVSDCYNTGSVKASFDDPELLNVGGIIGWADYQAEVYRCYNIGQLSIGSPDGIGNVGGIIGLSYMSDVGSCFYLEGTAADVIGSDDGSSVYGGSGAYSETEMKPGLDADEMFNAAQNDVSSIYYIGGWVFDGTDGPWTFIDGSNDGFPVLALMPHAYPNADAGNGDEGDGGSNGESSAGSDNGSKTIGGTVLLLAAAIALLTTIFFAFIIGKRRKEEDE